jgi:hypothetical protein
MCFLWDTNWVYVCYVEESRLYLWSSGQSFWLFRSPGSIPGSTKFSENSGTGSTQPRESTTEELLGRKSSVSGLESQEYGCRDRARWPCDGVLFSFSLTCVSDDRLILVEQSTGRIGTTCYQHVLRSIGELVQYRVIGLQVEWQQDWN